LGEEAERAEMEGVETISEEVALPYVRNRWSRYERLHFRIQGQGLDVFQGLSPRGFGT
jgi:hypothetical protein